MADIPLALSAKSKSVLAGFKGKILVPCSISAEDDILQAKKSSWGSQIWTLSIKTW